MRIRNRRGAITPAEGCMFFAVALFVVLLLGLLYIAFMRFGDPPPPSEAAPVTWSVPAGAPALAGSKRGDGAKGLHGLPAWRAEYDTSGEAHGV